MVGTFGRWAGPLLDGRDFWKLGVDFSLAKAHSKVVQDLTLLPEAAVWHAPSQTLVVADVHLGKAAAFRAGGIAVPDGDDARDLENLAALVEKHKASRLVVAGDMFHAPSGIRVELLELLKRFLDRIGVPVVLTIGNHDAKLRSIPSGVIAVDHLDLANEGPRIVHDPASSTPGRFHMAGHLHPVIRIRDGRRTCLRLPCFWQQENLLVLPAFGSFTGGSIIKPGPQDRVFTALRDQVVEIPAAAWG